MRVPAWVDRALEWAHRWWPRLLAYTWFPLLYVVTLLPTPSWRRPGPEPFMFCLLCGDRGGADFALNVAMFVPLGLLAVRRLGFVRTIMLGFGLSLGIELAQLTLAGRFSTLADIMANTTGAAVGATMYGVGSTLARGGRFSRSTGIVAALISGSLVLLGGWLVEPAPTDAAYWGQWTPDFGPGTRYPGEVLTAELNGRAFPSYQLPEALSDPGIFRTDWRLEGRVQKGEPPGSVTSVLSIFDAQQDEILYLGAFREHLVLRERLRAQDWHLDRPELVAWELLAPVPGGDAMRVAARREGDDRCLAVDEREACGLGFTTSSLWSLLLYPASAPRWMRTLAGLGVMFVLFFPGGLLAGSWATALVHGLLTASLMAAAIATTRLGFAPVLEVPGAVAGLVGGYLLAAGLRWAEARVSRTAPPAHL